MLFEENRQTGLVPLGDDHGDVVALFARAVGTNVADHGVKQSGRRQFTISLQCGDQPLFAEFFVGVVEGFGDAVGVKSKGITGIELALTQRAIPIFEEAEHSCSGAKTIDAMVAAQQERA